MATKNQLSSPKCLHFQTLAAEEPLQRVGQMRLCCWGKEAAAPPAAPGCVRQSTCTPCTPLLSPFNPRLGPVTRFASRPPHALKQVFTVSTRDKNNFPHQIHFSIWISMLLHFKSLSPDCICAVRSRTRFVLDKHTGKTERSKIVTETFVNQLIGPHPHKTVLVLLAQAMVMERNICSDGK